MLKHEIRDLTGDKEVEEQIRRYYNRKKMNEIRFTEGISEVERNRVDFTIDNSYLHEVSQHELDSLNRNYLKATERYYKADKARRRYEELQREEYISK